MAGYPIMIELAGQRVVVVGLGAVGRRRAQGLIEAGAKVIGVDPLGMADAELRGVKVLAEPYRETHLDGARLAIAAATPEVNRRIVANANRRGVIVNSSNEPGAGDFLVPAIWRSGPVVLGVSTSGAGPALAASLRDQAARAIGATTGEFVTLLKELRPIVLARVGEESIRQTVFRDWADPAWIERFETEGPEVVRAALIARIEEASRSGRCL